MHAHHTFVSVYATRLDHPGTGPMAPDQVFASRLQLTKISAFVLPRGIVTVRDNDVFDMKEVVRRWEDNSDLLRLGGGALLHGLLDVIVDGHFDTVQQLDDAIESLEDGLFAENEQTRKTQQRTFRIRKELVELRRVVLPMREVVSAVLRHRTELHKDGNELDGWFSDLYDHAIRAAEWSESLRDMLTSIFETSLSLQDARLNTVMKKLTGVGGHHRHPDRRDRLVRPERALPGLQPAVRRDRLDGDHPGDRGQPLRGVQTQGVDLVTPRGRRFGRMAA